jgi:hypothetical protein
MSVRPAQENDRIATRPVGLTGAATLLIVILATGFAFATLRGRRIVGTHDEPLPSGTLGIVEQGAILDAHRASDLQRAQRARLTQYRWLDERHDSAEIPIDRAMAIVAEKKR